MIEVQGKLSALLERLAADNARPIGARQSDRRPYRRARTPRRGAGCVHRRRRGPGRLVSPAPPERAAPPRAHAGTPASGVVGDGAQGAGRVLNSEEFVDEAPATVYAKLLDQGTYLASVPTMYRVLREHDEVRELRRQATHPAANKPELFATKTNEIYSWDITKLLGPEKWTYYYLYVIIDIHSRYVPGWMLAHADRGSPMTAEPVAFLLADLGVT